MNDPADFFDPTRHGFARVAVAVPRCRVADPAFNVEQSVDLLQRAAREGAALVLFPELGLSAYTCDDLFHQRALLDGCEAALARVVAASEGLATVAVVGLPLRVDHSLFNCAAVVHRGRLLGIVPKTYLPNYGEFYEARHFNPADHAQSTQILLFGQSVPFGADLLFEAEDVPNFCFHAEICEDLWVPIPPSSYAALGGATLLLNLSASNITVGKSAYRHALAEAQSARCLAAYLYSSAGQGESTTDLAWDGQALICENGQLLAEIGALRQRLAPDQRRRRSGAPGARTPAPDQLRPVGGAAPRATRRVSPRPLRAGAAADAARPAAAHGGALPVRAGQRRDARRALPRGLQHPGAGVDAAPGRKRHRQAGHRHLRRPRLDPRAAGVCTRHGRAGPAAQPHPGRDDARLRHQRRARSTRRTG